MTFKIKVKNNNPELFKKLRDALKNITRETSERWLPKFAHELQDHLPTRTGRLRSETRIETTDSGLRIKGPEYLLYLIMGTRPHEIFPRRAKALHFIYEGEEVFARRMYHPGFPPQPFLYESLTRALQFLPEACREAIEGMINA
jgi:hypothetical protein